MRSQHASSGFLRYLVACAGLLGLLLAIDAFALLLFVLLASVLGGAPPNPYAGILAFLLLPVLTLSGVGAAWGAYEYWCSTAPRPTDATVATR